MAVLDSQQLQHLEKLNNTKRKENAYGWPANTIGDLLETIAHFKSSKKKTQRRLHKKNDLLKRLNEVISAELSTVEYEDLES